MIRKEIKTDGTFGGNFPYNIDYSNLPENLIEIEEEQAYEIDSNIEKYRYINGEIVDISETQEYKDKITQTENQAKKANLQIQIEDLDKKRIRAICEPEIKDEESGQSWLEYYNLQVQELRNQIAEFS